MAFGPKKSKTADVAPEAEVKQSRSGIMTIPGVKVDNVKTIIIGTAPLVTHKFDEKMRRAMEAKQQGVAQGARQAKDPIAVFQGARYRLHDGTDGVPAGGVKACIVAGARGEVSATMTASKGAVLVKPDDLGANLVRIMTSDPDEGYLEPISRTDICRNATGVADVRYRPQYWPWAMLLDIELMPSLLSPNQFLQMVAHAGRAEGLCEWRPGSPKSKSGQWGTFRLADEEEIQAFEDGNLFKLLRSKLPSAEIKDEGPESFESYKVAAE